jgi:predicted small lipoprotein YifL
MTSILFSGPPRSAAKTARGALLALGIAALLGLTACGQRGPLVLPPKPQPVAPKSGTPPAAASQAAPAATASDKPGSAAATPSSVTPPVTSNKEPRP